jgi:acyl carrier protein phosphodiesterase
MGAALSARDTVELGTLYPVWADVRDERGHTLEARCEHHIEWVSAIMADRTRLCNARELMRGTQRRVVSGRVDSLWAHMMSQNPEWRSLGTVLMHAPRCGISTRTNPEYALWDDTFNKCHAIVMRTFG